MEFRPCKDVSVKVFKNGPSKICDVSVKVFKNGPSRICGRHSLKNFTCYIPEYLDSHVLDCENLIVITKQKPLIKIFNHRDLETKNPRIQNFKAKTLRYQFTMKNFPGKRQRGADALSKFPTVSSISAITFTEAKRSLLNCIREQYTPKDSKESEFNDHFISCQTIAAVKALAS